MSARLLEMNSAESPVAAEELLRQRAKKYAVPQDVDDRRIMDTVVVLGVGAQKIGIPNRALEVIARTPPVARIPGGGGVNRGVVHLRGRLLAVVDLGRWLGGSVTQTAPLLAVVVGPMDRRLGLLVDEAIGFREIAVEEWVDTFLDSQGAARRPVLGTTRDLISVLDVERLFAGAELVVGGANDLEGAGTP